ncbi:MAG: DNA/RNA non-specific endonuclease [Candidatus Cryptobacteroides sp.]
MASLIWEKYNESAMRNLLTLYMSVAAASSLLLACQKSDLAARQVHGLQFKSEKPVVEDASKTHWTGATINWSAGDAIRVGYTCDDVWQNAAGTALPDEADGSRTAKLFKSEPLAAASQTARFNVSGEFKGTAAGEYRFYGVFPSSVCYETTGFTNAPCVNVEIPSLQTPAADSFDAAADLMTAVSGLYDGIPSEPVSLLWTRKVAHAQITLKNLNGWTSGEKISKITIIADEAADMVGRHSLNLITGEIVPKSTNSTPNMLIVRGDNLSADASGNVTFWAAFLPCRITSLKVVVMSDKATYTREITSCDMNFTGNARNILSLKMSEAVREAFDYQSLPFEDGFDEITASSSSALTSLTNFSMEGSVYGGGAGVVRLAKSDGAGSLETCHLDLSSPFRVVVTAKGWDSDELKLTVTSGTQSKTVALQTYGTDSEFKDYTLDFSEVGCPATVTFSAAKGVRCYIDKISISNLDSEGSGDTEDAEALPQSKVVYAGCMEFPLVGLPSVPDTGSGVYGDDVWYATPTSDPGQILVSHSFSYDCARNRSLSLLFDQEKRCALWVACAFNSTTFGNNSVGRNENWVYDPALSTSIQPNLSSAYKNDADGNAYSRGHQVASNDRQTTAEENKQTFYYSNMTPQNQSLNAGQWAQLESAVQKFGASVSGRDTLYMVTGPVFDSGYTTTTDKSGAVCAIPSRYFKALMLCTFDEENNVVSAQGTAYLTTGNSAAANTAYSTWITSIDAVEEITGLDLFANIPSALQNSAEAQSSPLF